MGCGSGRATFTVDDYCNGLKQLDLQIKSFATLIAQLQNENITNAAELESNAVKQQIDSLQANINETVLRTKDEIASLPDDDDTGVTDRMSPIKYLLYFVKLDPPSVAMKIPNATAVLENTPISVSAA